MKPPIPEIGPTRKIDQQSPFRALGADGRRRRDASGNGSILHDDAHTWRVRTVLHGNR